MPYPPAPASAPVTEYLGSVCPSGGVSCPRKKICYRVSTIFVRPSVLLHSSLSPRRSIRATFWIASRNAVSTAIASGGPAIRVATGAPFHVQPFPALNSPCAEYRFTPAIPDTRWSAPNAIVGRRCSGNPTSRPSTVMDSTVYGAPSRSLQATAAAGGIAAARGPFFGVHAVRNITITAARTRMSIRVRDTGSGKHHPPMDAIRLQRVSEQIREELTELIEYEMSDPRVDGVTVTDVHVSPDGRKARIMVSLASPEGRDDAMAALENARAYLRTQVAQRLALHRTPDLQFELDSVIDPAHLNKILKRIRKGRPKE